MQDAIKHTILIVDDDATNRLFLDEVLGDDYHVLMAASGPQALVLANATPSPRVILLDIMMPGMNGFEVCQRLQDSAKTKDIAVLFVSAMSDVASELEGLSYGAVDYITKPLKIPVVQARVKTHVRLHLAKEQIEAQKNELIAMHQRQAKSIHASRLVTLGEMATGVAHELNQPLGGISLAAKFVRKSSEMGKLSNEDLIDSIDDIDTCVARMSKIINHMRAFARQDAVAFETVNISETIDGAMTLLGEQFRLHGVDFITDYSQELPGIVASFSQLEQVWINLMTNARDALDEKAESVKDFQKTLKITVIENATSNTIDVSFTDNGSGMPDHVKTKIFDPFYTTKEVGKGTGLGLSISHGIIANHQGIFEVDSLDGAGTTIRVKLPYESD